MNVETICVNVNVQNEMLENYFKTQKFHDSINIQTISFPQKQKQTNNHSTTHLRMQEMMGLNTRN